MKNAASPLLLFLAYFFSPALSSLQLQGEHAHHDRMHCVVASEWSGPSDFNTNTSVTNAELVDAGHLEQFCDDTSHVAPDSLGSLAGKTILVSLHVTMLGRSPNFRLSCPLPEAFANLVDAGVLGVVAFNEIFSEEPGRRVYSRGWSNRRLFAAKEKTVPFVEVGLADGETLRALLAKSRAGKILADGDADAAPVHMLLSPDTNAWIGWYHSWLWILVQRVLMPTGYALVVWVAARVSSGGYKWGSTKASARQQLNCCACYYMRPNTAG